jgi:isopentenyl-diphosphate Delta-isomerase
LREELGIDDTANGCALEERFCFRYRAVVGPGLYENEYDHVLVGEWRGTPVPNPEEVSECAWMKLSEIHAAIDSTPAMFAVWFVRLLPEMLRHRSSSSS